MDKNGVRMNSPFWMDARGFTGQDNATSGKHEDRFYVMKGAEAKENQSKSKVFVG